MRRRQWEAILRRGGEHERGRGAGSLQLNNRKYLGAKHRLLDFIHDTVLSRVASPAFIDGFAGTGVVGLRFRAHARRIVSNDLLYSNFVVNQAFLNSTPRNVDLGRVEELLDGLNRLPPRRGYAFRQYGGRYFTARNAGRIDAVRERIEELAGEGRCTPQERYLLLASLLYAADKAANTVGQYDAFLKHLVRRAQEDQGRHLVDSNVHKPLRLRLPDVELGEGGHQVYNEDLNRIIGRLAGEVLYLDPPYNGRQYIDCYHVLENILRWRGRRCTARRASSRADALKSRYSRRPEAAQALAELVAGGGSATTSSSATTARASSPTGKSQAILARKGRCEVFEREYAVFGNGAGSARRRTVRERIFYCRAAGA